MTHPGLSQMETSATYQKAVPGMCECLVEDATPPHGATGINYKTEIWVPYWV